MEESAKYWHLPKDGEVKFNKSHYKNICGDDLAEEPAAFCRSRNHIGYLSASQVQNHQCVKKDCPHLIKNNKHSFWKQKSDNKIRKKYFQLIDKLYLDGKLSKNNIDKLKQVTSVSMMENLILSMDPRIEAETKKGKILIYEIINGQPIQRTQAFICEKFFGKNMGKCRELWVEMSKSINDWKYIIEKREVSKLGKYREALYRYIKLGQSFLIFGKGIKPEYSSAIYKILLARGE